MTCKHDICRDCIAKIVANVVLTCRADEAGHSMMIISPRLRNLIDEMRHDERDAWDAWEERRGFELKTPEWAKRYV